MSSPTVRAAILATLAANWTATPVFDLSDWVSFADIPQGDADAMLLIQFVGGPERLATIGQIENHSWREDGIIFFHLCFPTGENSARALTLGEQLVTMFRGRRFGTFVVDFMEHFSDFNGAAIQLNGRWHGWTSGLGYSSRICA
jgi:hypothetical protein